MGFWLHFTPNLFLSLVSCAVYGGQTIFTTLLELNIIYRISRIGLIHLAYGQSYYWHSFSALGWNL